MITNVFSALFSWLSTTFFGKVVTSIGLSLIASLISGGLSRPPVKEERDRRSAETSLEGNVQRAGAPIPRVLGSQRVYPALIAEPLVVYEAGQEVVEGVYALAGPHDLEEVKIGESPASLMPGVEVAIYDGTRRSRPQRLIRRYGFTDAFDAELTGPRVRSDGVTYDTSLVDIAGAVPQPIIGRSVAGADELWIHLAWPQGLHRAGAEDDPVRTPVRIRMRRVGGAGWRNLPELHVRGRGFEPRRRAIRIIWSADAPAPDVIPGDGWCAAYHSVPKADSGSGGGWQADGTFASGPGHSRLDAGVVPTTRLRRIVIDPFEVRLYLHPAQWIPGEWEIEVTRGGTFREASFDAETYAYNGTARDWFGWYGTPPRIAESQGPIQDTVSLVRIVSVVNSSPNPDRRVAVIAVRARGVRVERLSVMAHGLVRRWAGDPGAESFHRSDNPADLMHDVLASPDWAYPARPEDFDLPTLLDWRARCLSNGWRCNGVVEDTSLAEVMRIICGAGYARPRLTGLISVIQDYDRSAEEPVHIFTPRNSAAMVWRQSRVDLPSGLRVTWRDREGAPQEVIVWAGRDRDPKRLEAVEYESVQNEGEARDRAIYDLRVGRFRRVVYAVQAPPSAMALLPGSLVGVVSDSLSDVMAAGVISARLAPAMGIDGDGNALLLTVGGKDHALYQLTIQPTVNPAMGIDGDGNALLLAVGGEDHALYQLTVQPLVNTLFRGLGAPSWGDAVTMQDLVDMRRAGSVIGASIQQLDGSWITYATEPLETETRILRLVDAPDDALRPGAEVAIGILGEIERMVVAEIAPDADFSARMILLPDASAEIWGSV